MSALRIVIADDQPINLKLLSAQLQAEGHIVLTARNGIEALEVLEREEVDLIISDILMPGMDGYRLCAQVRARETLRHLPFIFYTATYTSPADEHLCAQVGADRYLRKPISSAELHAAIDEVLRSPRPSPDRQLEGEDILVEYSERLVFKLEQKNLELTTAKDRLSAALEQLGESERRLTEMLNNLDLVATMLDHEANIIYCNDHFLRLTGWQREEVIGANWFDHFAPPDQAEELRAVFESLFAESPIARHHTNEIVTRSGERRLLQWNNSLLRSTTGAVIGTASIAEDITDRRRLEQQMIRAQRLESLGTLAGGIAHDMNNLLMPILMGVSVLKRLPPGEQARQALDNIERSARRGSDLVKQVLLFARGGDSARERLDTEQIIREVGSIARSTFPRSIEFEVIVADDLAPISGDSTQLTQVLLNLCVNARDAMPSGGRITIRASNQLLSEQDVRMRGGKSGGSYVVIEVSDTGEGMSAETLDRIFDPFFTTKEIGKGTGLGLSTVQGIVASHGGFVSVSSTVGEGSSFLVHVPAVAGTAEGVRGEAELQPVQRGNGQRILLVDDDPAVLSMTRQTLETFGYRVLTATDGANAVAVFAQHQEEIDLVLTDMVMPVLDGPALIAALSRIDPQVKIIGTTGDASPAVLEKVAKTGMKSMLIKPYTVEVLLETIATALGGS